MSKSRLEGTIRNDYLIIKKIIKNNRSAYLVKCMVCGSVKEIYNLDKSNLRHSEYCPNFINHILGEIHGDYIIQKAYRKDRIYVDMECLICGSSRDKVAYKDIKSTFKNKHGIQCTIKNTKVFKNQELVKKLRRTFSNIKSRLRLANEGSFKYRAYKNLTTDFKDATEFICFMYPLFEKRLSEGTPMNELSVDRINPNKGYLRDNVRCLTLQEQHLNKRNTKKYCINGVEFTNLRDFCRELEISERDFYNYYNVYNELQIINNKRVMIEKLHNVETIETGSVTQK